MKQTVAGEAAFAGYGVTFAPLQHDDYAQRSVSGKVAVFLGRTGPKGGRIISVRESGKDRPVESRLVWIARGNKAGPPEGGPYVPLRRTSAFRD